MYKIKNILKEKRWGHLLIPLSLFSSPQYRLLWLISTLVNAGQWTFLFIAGWNAYSLTHSSTWSGAIIFAIFVPSLIASPFIGVILDKVNRKNILILAIFFASFFNLLLSILSINNDLSIILLFIFTLLYGTSFSFLGVSINTLLPSTVPSKRLFVAVHLQSIAQRGAEFIGPAIATLLMVNNQSSRVYLLTMVLYGIALLFSLFLTREHTTIKHTKQSIRFTSQIKKGLFYVTHTKSLRTIISLTSLHCILTMSYTGLLPTYVNKYINKNAEFYGSLLTYTGLGAIFGILILTLWNYSKLRNSLLYLTALLSGLSLVTLSISLNPTVIGLSVFLAGFSQGMFMTLAVAMIQELTDEQFRGRVNSVYVLSTTGFMSLFNLLYGTITSFFSVRILIDLMGSSFLMIVLLYWIASPSIYKISKKSDDPQESIQTLVG